mgnify:CR=1 FL=1
MARFISFLATALFALGLPAGSFAAQAPAQCEDGQPCTDTVREKSLPGRSRTKPAISHSKMKELERNPGATKALRQDNIRALKKHKSLEGTPGVMPGHGPDSAKVKVFVFSDFQCPVCRRVVEPVKLVARDYPKDVQVIFIQNALVMHRNAETAALGALAAARQNKFWEFHDRLFQEQSRLTEADMVAHAQALGLNVERFKKDMKAPESLAQVVYERNLSTALGVRGTPGFYINGRKMVGWGSYSGFKALVERAMKQAQTVVGAKGPGGVAAKATKDNGDDGKKFADLVWGIR